MSILQIPAKLNGYPVVKATLGQGKAIVFVVKETGAYHRFIVARFYQSNLVDNSWSSGCYFNDFESANKCFSELSAELNGRAINTSILAIS